MTQRSRHGQATISLVLLIGGIATAVVIAIALIAVSMIGTGFAADQQQRARAAAMAGIDDAAIRLARNPNDAGSYTVTAGTISTSVTIAANTPSAGFATITSQATSGVRRSRLTAVYSFDGITKVPTLVSLSAQ